MAVDPQVAKRNWQHVMEEILKFKKGATLQRWQTAIKDKAFDAIRTLPLLETQAEQLRAALEKGTVSTNVHLRKLHNFCMDMNWLPWPVIPKKQWPPVEYKIKRAITLAEHQAIIAHEANRERRDFYQLYWHWGPVRVTLRSFALKMWIGPTAPSAFSGKRPGCRWLSIWGQRSWKF